MDAAASKPGNTPRQLLPKIQPRKRSHLEWLLKLTWTVMGIEMRYVVTVSTVEKLVEHSRPELQNTATKPWPPKYHHICHSTFLLIDKIHLSIVVVDDACYIMAVAVSTSLNFHMVTPASISKSCFDTALKVSCQAKSHDHISHEWITSDNVRGSWLEK